MKLHLIHWRCRNLATAHLIMQNCRERLPRPFEKQCYVTLCAESGFLESHFYKRHIYAIKVVI